MRSHALNNRLSGTLPASLFQVNATSCQITHAQCLADPESYWCNIGDHRNAFTCPVPPLSSSNCSANLGIMCPPPGAPPGAPPPQPATPTTQVQALGALYAAAGGAGWITNTHWMSGDPCTLGSTWHGIGCSGGEVNSLWLLGNNLTGTIPSEIGLLTAITTSLILSEGGLSGTIPSEVGLLTAITGSLDISINRLTGSVPTELGMLTAVAGSFDINANSLSGTVPSELGLLSGITGWFHLYSNRLSGTLPIELGKLNPAHCSFTNTQCLAIWGCPMVNGNHFACPVPPLSPNCSNSLDITCPPPALPPFSPALQPPPSSPFPPPPSPPLSPALQPPPLSPFPPPLSPSTSQPSVSQPPSHLPPPSLAPRQLLVPTPCTTVTFTQTLYANDATTADACSSRCQFDLKLAYDGVTGCRVPSCQSSLTLNDGGPSTNVVLHQSIAGDAASLTIWSQTRLQEFYNVHLGCRAPFCIGTLDLVAGSISMSMVLDIPDAPAGRIAYNASSTAAAVTAAARALAAQPMAVLSAMMNETVVSTSLPVVRRVRRIDIQLVMSIPDANVNANATVAAITASANTLATQSTPVASLLNATVISTSPVVVGHAVVPLVVSDTSTALAGHGIPMDVILFALLIAVLVVVVACARLVRGRQDWCAPLSLTTQKQGENEAFRWAYPGETELYSSEQTPRALSEHAQERLREERQQEARSAQHSSSYVMESREDV